MKTTETSGNRQNKIRGQRISYYAEVDNKLYLVGRMTVTSKFGAKNYIRQHPKGEYAANHREEIKKVEQIEKTKNIRGLVRVSPSSYKELTE